MTSARAPCLRLRLAGARHIYRPLEFPRPARTLAFPDKVGEPTRPLCADLSTHAGSTANNTWIGRVDLIEPGHDDLCCQRNRKAARSSKCGKHPTTNSSLRSRSSHLRSQLRIRNLCSLCSLCTLGSLC